MDRFVDMFDAGKAVCPAKNNNDKLKELKTAASRGFTLERFGQDA